jgi:hypothetical protein
MRRLARHIFFSGKEAIATACGPGKEKERIMAIFHMEAKVITRGVGRTACGAAAYMSCSSIYNDYDGIQHDYTRKGGLVWEHVFLPPMAPSEWQDREKLWNAVEAVEKTKDSRLAREFVVALPVEFDRQMWIGMVSEFIQEQFVSDGMCADAAIHDTDGHNPHVHILLTMRPLNEDGSWHNKTEKEYLCVRDGKEQGFTAAEFKTAQAEGWEKQYLYQVGKERLYLPPSVAQKKGFERVNKHPCSTKYGRQNPITARWNSEEQLVDWRAAWADHTNRWLERNGVEDRIDHRSHAERGLDEKPTIHEGVSARRLEAAGYISERCEINRQIKADNALIRRLKSAIVKLKKAVETTIPAIAAAMETVRQNIIVFNYGLLVIRDQRKGKKEYVEKAKQIYTEYTTLHEQIRARLEERSRLQQELEGLSLFNIGKRKELKTQLAAISEEIEELRFEEKSVMQTFDKEDAAGMKKAKIEISSVEADVVKLDKQESALTAAVEKEQEKFSELKEQASDLDPGELTDARLSLRPQMEDQAKERIRGAVSSGKIRFWDFLASVQNADKQLGEDDLAERRDREKRQADREITNNSQNRKPRRHEHER